MPVPGFDVPENYYDPDVEEQPMADDNQHTPTPWRVEEGTDLIWGACNPDDQSTYGMGYSIVQGKPPAWKPHKPTMAEREANAALIVEAVNNYARLRADLERANQTIDVLESNARVQAKLLADTGRENEAMRKALEKIEELQLEPSGNRHREILIAQEIAQRALMLIGQSRSGDSQ